MSGKPVREDPIKMHKDASSLMEGGKFGEAREMFVRTAELYFKGQNYFGASEMNYKAGECSFSLKEYEKAVELFLKASDIAFDKGFDRYGLSALEQARDSYMAWGKTAEAEELTKRITEINKKNEEPEGESSFSVFS